jgi:hypothetical protein
MKWNGKAGVHLPKKENQYAWQYLLVHNAQCCAYDKEMLFWMVVLSRAYRVFNKNLLPGPLPSSRHRHK